MSRQIAVSFGLAVQMDAQRLQACTTVELKRYVTETALSSRSADKTQPEK